MSFNRALGGPARRKRISELLPKNERPSRIQDLIYCEMYGDSGADLKSMTDDAIAALTKADIETMTRQREVVERKKIVESYAALVKKEFLSNGNEIGATITCWKCGSKNIEINVKQTRSADEGSTTFCKCPKCGTRWRMG